MAPVRRGMIVAAIGVAIGLVAGCGGGGATKPATTASVMSASVSVTPSSPAPSHTPSPSVSIPVEAMAQTPEGALAFVRFYISELNRSWRLADAHVLPPLHTATCNSCANFQQLSEGYVADGTRVSGDSLVSSDLTLRAGAPDGEAFVDCAVEQSAVDVVDSKGDKVDVTPSTSGRYTFALRWVDGHWRVNGVVRQ